MSNAQGKPVGTATAISLGVAPGGTVTATGTGFPDGPVPSMRCKVTNVSRSPHVPMASDEGWPSDLHLPDGGAPHLDLDLPHIHLGHGHK